MYIYMHHTTCTCTCVHVYHIEVYLLFYIMICDFVLLFVV